jgi:hypothetical protein
MASDHRRARGRTRRANGNLLPLKRHVASAVAAVIRAAFCRSRHRLRAAFRSSATSAPAAAASSGPATCARPPKRKARDFNLQSPAQTHFQTPSPQTFLGVGQVGDGLRRRRSPIAGRPPEVRVPAHSGAGATVTAARSAQGERSGAASFGSLGEAGSGC